jgi:hypothetical protein
MIRQSVSGLAKRSCAIGNNLKRDPSGPTKTFVPQKAGFVFSGRTIGRHNPARISRYKNCRLTNKSPRAIGRGDFRNLWSESTCYFKTIAVNG